MGRLNSKRVKKTLDDINQFGATKSGMFRLAYSAEEKAAQEYIMTVCKKSGFSVRVDQAGNVIIRRSGLDDSLPAVAIGSHLDTVYNGGKYDGVVGVVAGIEVLQQLEERQIETLHPVELIIFACEESARFHVAMIGSRAMIGELDKEYVGLLKDKNNQSIVEVFHERSLNFQEIEQAKRKKSELKVFFELHIEQGCRLIEEDKTIGIVTGIAAPIRLSLTVVGKSSHSGTTTMEHRRDSFLAAAELSLALEEAAKTEKRFDTVATVGVVDVQPGAINVIPGKTNLKVDIRSISRKSRGRVLAMLEEAIKEVEAKRKVEVLLNWKTDEDPIQMDEIIAKNVQSICERRKISSMFMPSGAGHDAMNMAKCWPTALLFVPSVHGLSHHPDEFTKVEDIVQGVAVLKDLVLSHAIARKE
ncbi:N-carbamoyl-L-amino acid hydrolase [Halalkalibacter wakoensis JCM 9140]|uniref:N-carbamoyl-L-amino acid hydrolase n=1 Tax=Halalkalibacter wakoensis JCM 9140 TaxID=1236970 RepID=W4Q672_9BACI|nr:Zn-dependent hydrolase [Halalkalibacter wakoensis]GAE27571.1 N-carbamoyl-L-amino acid hydrolase [Halalkalibacter wakoensis JCM 9140]